ncbi:MAG: twin-arginine translocase TatA/TatE family subunit [Thermoleophilia bacterium]|nr:twin-arginine translocase TatA/TatE family subunit [Thermoleophilia bacterium]
MPSIGWQEVLIVMFLVLLIFGPKRLPEIGRSVGKSIKEFRTSTSDIKEQIMPEQTHAETAVKADSAATSRS